MAGRPSKTKEEKSLKGTLRPHRETPDVMEPERLSDIPMAPEDLDAIGQSVWYSTATQLQHLGVLSTLDLVILKEYCYQVSLMEISKQELKGGLTVMMTNKGGGQYPVKSPYISIYNEALSHATRIAQQFGLTPSSRQKISAKPKKEEQKNPWDEL